MAIRTYKVTLDSKNAIAPEPVFLRQGDKTGAVVIDATLMDNGSPVSLDGLTPMFKANTADGQAVIVDSTGFNIVDDSGGEFTYQVPNALSSVPGKIVTAYFSFSDASGSESTFDVAFIIKKAVDATQAQADDYITIIDGTIQSLQQKIDAMNTDIQTILNAYNQGDFYNQAQTDDKDAATLASAQSYVDTKPLMQYKDTTGTLTTAATNDGTTMYPRTEWLGLTDMPRNTAYNYGQGLKVIAHRGNNAEWPENSLPAFRRTGRFWGIETDTTVTSDGTWVIMHDSTVDRTTNGTGTVTAMTYAEIEALRIDVGNNVAFCRDNELVVPRVSDYLQVCKEVNKVPILEIKDATYTAANYDNLASAIRSLGWESQMWIISFGFTHLQEMRNRIPNLPVQYLVNTYSDAAVDQVAALGANVAIDTGSMSTVTDENVAYAHNKGVLFNVWTGSDSTDVGSLAGLGVDFLTKNGLSGNRKYATLVLQNDWVNHPKTSGAEPSESWVAQIGSGYVHLSFNVEGGTTTHGSTIAQLPDWATPCDTVWANCVIRTPSGVVLGTIDINGRKISNPYRLLVGLNWDQVSPTGWIAGEITYYVGV